LVAVPHEDRVPGHTVHRIRTVILPGCGNPAAACGPC
jgi:hypothetical protein